MATVQSLYDELSKQYVGVTMEQMGDSYKINCDNEFTLYVPENFSDSTEAYAFFQGGGGGEGEINVGKAIEESIKKENSDKIVCVTGCGDVTGMSNVLNTVSGGKGFTNYYNMGWSAGGTVALNNTIQYINSNPKAAPQTTVLLESAFNGASLGNLSNSNLNALKNNGTTIIVMEDANIPGYNSNESFLKLAQNTNVVIVENTDKHYDSEGHVQVPVDALNENIMGVLSGDATQLEYARDHYKYKMLNHQAGQFEYVDAETGIKAMTANISSSKNGFKFDPDHLEDAIRLAKNAASDISGTPTTISEAIELSSDVQVDISDWISATSDALVQMNAVSEMAQKLESILNELLPLDGLLSDFVDKYGNNAAMIPQYVSEALASGKLTQENLASFMGKMVENGILTGSNMQDVIPNMVVNGTLDASALMNVASVCQELLAKQGVNANGSTNFASTGYYRNLQLTSCPVDNIQQKLIDMLVSSGVDSEQAQKFANGFIDDYNSALGQKLVDQNMMYSGDGVAQAAFATIGLFTSFGYMLDYSNSSFESNGKNGLMLGTDGRYVSSLDCNNSFDFLARCAGMNASGYNAANKEMYAVTIKEIVESGHDSKSYWHDQMVKDGRIQECLNEDGTFNSGFKDGNVGDIIVCENGAHMLTIVSKDANGYYVAEETSSTTRGQGFRIHYYNYDDIRKLEGTDGYSPSEAYVVHMDNFYGNQSKVNKETGFVTYGYDASGNIIEINEGIYYGDDSQAYGHCNNYIPPEVIASGLGLSKATEELLKGEYNYRNENRNVGEYNVSESIMNKINEIEMLKKKNANIPSTNNPIKMDVPEYGREKKRWMYASSVTSVESDQYKFLHSGDVYEDTDGFCKYKDASGQEYYCVALGTYYCGGNVGEKFKIDLKNEDGTINSIYVVTADVKSDKHTDPKHQYTYGSNGSENGNILEFVVGDSFINVQKDAAFTGDCSKAEGLSGMIESIYYIGSTSNNTNYSSGTLPSGGSSSGSGNNIPSEPTKPDTPSEPTKPDTPSEPTKPDTPSEPTKPDTPSEPSKPDTPSEPTKPDTPSEPTKPDTPSEPTKPDTPSEPTKPGNSYTPNRPSTPSTPSKPSSPSNGSNSSIKEPTGGSDIGWDIPIIDDSDNLNTPSEPDKPIIEPIPVTPTTPDNTIADNSTNNIDNNINSNTSSSGGASAIGIALGAAAVTGAAIAGKKIYDKYQEKDENKDVEDKYFEDYDMSKANFTVEKHETDENNEEDNNDNSGTSESEPEVNPYYT